jgi:hypothetical protein
MTLEETLLAVWRQTLVEQSKTVQIGEVSFSVRTTAKQKLKQVDFQFEGRVLRGLEQNPDTRSQWAVLARQGHKVMQFLEGGIYVGVVADWMVKLYPKRDL